MNQTLQTVKVGLFFILGIVLITIVYSVIGNRQLASKEGYELKATFDNIKTVSVGNEVRMAGVRIGEVDSTSLSQGKGVLTLQIEKETKIPSDSVASIAMSSLLGQNYIAIQYGNSKQFLDSGKSIQTLESADFNDILQEVKVLGERLNGIADQFSGMGGDGMNSLFTNLNELVTDNRDKFDSVLRNLDEITTKLNQSEGTLGKLINDDQIYEELSLAVSDIRKAASSAESGMTQAQNLFARIDSGEGALGKLLSDESIAAEIDATIANLRNFSEKLNSGEGTLGKLVNDDSLYIELQSLLNRADQALDSVGDSGPITAAGAVSNALF